MMIRLIVPDDEQYIIVRSIKLRDDKSVEKMHSFAGFVTRDPEAMDECIEVNMCGNMTSS